MPRHREAIRHRFQRVGALLSVMLMAVAATGTETPPAEQIREPVIAGSWYPGHPDELRAVLGTFLARADSRPQNSRLGALIVPHAGYRYSGQVAAHAFKLLEKQAPDTVVIIAPSHHARFEGISVYDRGG